MTIGLEDFLIDAYDIPLDSFDIILGVQFLRTLGPTLWDLEDLQADSVERHGLLTR
jgi:hypothetical protein